MGCSSNGGTPKWLVHKGISHSKGWFGGNPICGDPPNMLRIWSFEVSYLEMVADPGKIWKDLRMVLWCHLMLFVNAVQCQANMYVLFVPQPDTPNSRVESFRIYFGSKLLTPTNWIQQVIGMTAAICGSPLSQDNLSDAECSFTTGIHSHLAFSRPTDGRRFDTEMLRLSLFGAMLRGALWFWQVVSHLWNTA